MTITIKPSLLALSISLLSYNAYALEAISDEVMGDITGQDGISFHATADRIDMDRLFWREEGKEMQLRNLRIDNLDATLTADVGADSDLASANPALAWSLTVQPMLLSVGSIGLCNANTACTNTFGEMAIETTTPSTFSAFNTNGLFDGNTSNGRFRFNISKANIYFGQTFGGVRNLAILKDFTLNGSVNGKFTIDAVEGLRTQGTLSLNRNAATRTHGLQFDIAHRANLPTGFSTVGAKDVVRFGISGNILNLDLKMKADNSLATGVANSQGVKLGFSGSLDRNNFQMEVGRSDTYSMIFRNWVDFANGAAVTPSNPKFTFGDVYFNILPATGTLPNFTTGYGAGFGSIGGNSADAFSIAVRGLNFQAYPKTLTFQNNTTFVQNSQNWSLISAVHNLDANVLLYPDGHPNVGVTPKRGIGFDIKMATTGRDVTGKEGTHFMIADPTAGSYIGMRNVNAHIQLNQGQFYLVDTATDGIDGVKLTSKDMRFDLSGELAVGRLPNGSSVTTIRDDDELFGLRIRMEGELGIVFAPPPQGGYLPIIAVPLLNIPVGLGISGEIKLVDPNSTWHNTLANSVLPDPNGLRNSLVISEPSDGTELQLADISGTLAIRPEHIAQGEFADRPSIIGHGSADFSDVSRIEVGNQTVTLSTALEFGSGTLATDVFRIGDFVLGIENDNNPATPILEANRYRLGEMVITGGRLYSQLTIMPQ